MHTHESNMLPPDWGRWHPSQPVAVYADTFVYFWVFWGVLVVLFLILHIIRLISDCLDRCEPLPEPAESIYKPDHSADFKTCSICLEDFVENDKLHWLPCSHVFHADCVDEWIRMHHLQCPVCLTGIKGHIDETSPLLQSPRQVVDVGPRQSIDE